MNNDIRIVVLQRGWVLIGRFAQNGTQCTLADASVIRRWGTTKGLGELFNGPTRDTILEKSNGIARFHELTVVLTIDCNHDAWDDKL